jgi:hypothetical protein
MRSSVVLRDAGLDEDFKGCHGRRSAMLMLPQQGRPGKRALLMKAMP